MEKQKKILIAPLDWGWGHATRCLPIIDYLLSKKINVVVAGNENYKKFIEEKYPTLPFIFLKGYDVKYASSAKLLGIKIAFQLPKIISRIYYENRWLKKQQELEQFDAVISDNRFGLFTKKCISIFITHQVEIETPLLKKIVNKLNWFFIKKYHELWIADYQENSFAGNLSTLTKKFPAKFLGNLSQLSSVKKDKEKTIDMLCILSGPEPQRSIFEKIIISIFKKSNNKNCVLIQGLKSISVEISKNENMTIIPFANSNEIEHYFQQSKIIICRSGYSTIMDLVKQHKNAVLIPTPGQSEQEYLGKYLAEKKYFLTATQHENEIENAIKKIENYVFNPYPILNMEQYKNVIDDFIQKFS